MGKTTVTPTEGCVKRTSWEELLGLPDASQDNNSDTEHPAPQRGFRSPAITRRSGPGPAVTHLCSYASSHLPDSTIRR